MKKIWKIRRDEEAVSPVIATILMVAITVVLAAVLYIMVSGMTGTDTDLDSVGGTMSPVSGGWLFTCTRGTKSFPATSTYVFIQTEQGATVYYRTDIDSIDNATEATTAKIRFNDNNIDGKLNAGDTIYIETGAYKPLSTSTPSLSTPNGAKSDNTIQILTSETILFDRSLP